VANNNSIVRIENANDIEWPKIVDQIVESMGDCLPEDVIRATELLLAGYPTHEVAKELHTSSKQIKIWLNKYPSMAMAIANGRKLLTKWRLAKLEQQFVKAIDKSEELLELDFNNKEVNQKLVATVGQHARYIIGLFAGQKIDININLREDESVLNAQQDALAYIANQVSKNRRESEPIEAEYEVVPVNNHKTPLLSPSGEPPFGMIGMLDNTENGVLCHVCGKRSKILPMHISTEHGINAREYELIYMLEEGSVTKRG